VRSTDRDGGRGQRLRPILHSIRDALAATLAHLVTRRDDEHLRHIVLHLTAPPCLVRRVSEIPKSEEERHARRSSAERKRRRVGVAEPPEVRGGGEREVRGGLGLPPRR